MKIAAYCRVSTDKADQLNSLEAQKEFFSEYTQRTGDVLVKLYADEGISGTKIKNRKEFLRMMADAEKGMFDMVVVKDISRFARNTVDLLQNVRKLKALGIETQFLTANMTSMGNSEFVLTIFGALAQEESANTSKRVKFGKKLNAEKGRVPNIVYGYDKTIGDYFNLEINKEESKVVKQIYKWYTEEGYGAAKISNMLNEKGYRTKRNCKWSQNAICRILTNEIYTGKIINGKQEIPVFIEQGKAPLFCFCNAADRHSSSSTIISMLARLAGAAGAGASAFAAGFATSGASSMDAFFFAAAPFFPTFNLSAFSRTCFSISANSSGCSSK